MSSKILFFKGLNGQITLYDDRVVISRKGLLSKSVGLFKGEKEINLNAINGIQLKSGNLWANGYIQFIVPGYIESKGGVFDATKDENSVLFTRKDNDKAAALKERIQELQKKSTSKNSMTLSASDEILKFKSLLDQGIISEEEFKAKKKQLLDL